MFNNLSIRKKLALLLVGPLLALLAIAGLGIRGGLSDLSSATDADRRVDMALLNGRLFDALRAEAVQNQNSVMAQQNLDEVRAATDAASAAWLAKAPLFDQLDVSDLIDDVRDIGSHRDVVTAEFATNGAGAEIVYDADMALLTELVAFDARVTGRAEADVAAELLKASDLNDAALAAADAQLLGMWAAHSGTIPNADLAERLGQTSSLLDAYFFRALPAEQVREVEGDLVTLRAELLSAAAGEATTVTPAAWESASEDQATAIAEARRTLINRAGAAAAASTSDAQGTTRNLGALALIGLLLGLGALLLVGNGLRKRLTTLSSEAAALAKHDLPDLAVTVSGGEPTAREERPIVQVEGSDEIAEVSERLNDIRRATESVALQQDDLLQSGISDMFVNLARRNQTLVDRQLEVIDQLESNERDSDRLAQMYRVDHLATRMRRNAESLLVLAGQSSPRRRGPAVDLREVVRVAIGEVEDYRRIVPVALDDLLVAGHVAQDLAHLLSELMENATQSSAPGTVADVIGLADASGAYTLQVIDRGTGLDEERRAELNHLLANPPSNSLSMSRSLGLTVVGRLAERMALTVVLSPGTDGGTIAAVSIPADVVAEWRAGEPTTILNAPLPEPEVAAAPIPEPAAAEPSGMFDLGNFGMETEAPAAPTESIPIVEAPAAEQPAPVFQEPVLDPAPAAPAFPAAAVEAVPTTPSEVFGAVDVPPLAEAPAPIFDPSTVAPEPPAFEPIAEAPVAPAPPVFEPMAEAPVAPAPPVFEPIAEAPAASAPPAFAPLGEAPVAPAPPAFEPMAEAPVAPAPPAFEPIAEAAPAPPAFAPLGDAPAAPAPPSFEPVAETPSLADLPAPPPSFDAPPMVPPTMPTPEPMAAAPQMDVPPSPPTLPDAPYDNSGAEEPGAVFDLLEPEAPMAPVAEAPAPTPPTPEPATTPTGLVRRRRSSPNGDAPRIDDTRTAPSKRSPDQVKSMLSRYKTGLERGRSGGQEPGQ